jgi:hypothetical protein
MRILLLEKNPYLDGLKGGSKADRALMECLAARGHECIAVAPAAGDEEGDEILVSGSVRVVVATHEGVRVHAVAAAAGQDDIVAGYLVAVIEREQPDVVMSGVVDLVPLVERAGSPPFVYLAHVAAHLPFGPAAWRPDPCVTARLQAVAGIIAPSEYIAGYIREFGNLSATAIPCLGYGRGPFPSFGDFDTGAITMINPCAGKGGSLFMALASVLTDRRFLAVPTWGTTDEERAALERLANVAITPADKDIDRIFARTKVLLVPSLWHESFGMLVVEAMARGIPVFASDVGGLPEAKLGVPYLIPVAPIEGHTDEIDSRGLPIPIIPKQELAPWIEALDDLLASRSRYQEVAALSARAAQDYIASLDCAATERYLAGICRTPA